MGKFDNNYVSRDGNVITIASLQNADSVNQFIAVMRHGRIKHKYEDCTIVFDKSIQGVYPNAVVPICGLIEFFRREKKMSIEGKSYDANLQAILTPYELPAHKENLSHALNKIWKFQNGRDVYEIQTAIVNELRRMEIFAPGVLEGIEWSINEIMDNVLNHSESPCGFIMGQLHKTSKHVAFTIYDAGIGIYKSLKNSIHAPRKNADALTMCIKAGVTRDKKVGQGNGMNGLFSLVKEGNGRLVITSGRDSYEYVEGNGIIKENKHQYPSEQNFSTTVDFQLDYSKDISIDKVLTFHGKRFEFTNLYAENLENEYGELVFNIAELAEGTGTRDSALRLKNEIVNLISAKSQVAILDFNGVGVATSSFIDELVAKLLVELGLFQFNQRIKLTNMSMLLQQTLQKAVIQRIIEEFNDDYTSRI